MTIQLSDYIYYNDKEYSLLYKEGQIRLFNPRKYGFHPLFNSKSCYKGYICTYEIYENELFLDKLEINNKRALKFNNKRPCKFKRFNYSQNGKLEGFKYVYKNLDFNLSYSGEILIGRIPFSCDFDKNYYHENCLKSPHSFEKVYKLIFKKGRLINVINESYNLKHMRKVLRMEYLYKDKLNIKENDFGYREDEIYKVPRMYYKEEYYLGEDYYKK
ncbi:hypothetical protein [Terrisporobacter sp.]